MARKTAKNTRALPRSFSKMTMISEMPHIKEQNCDWFADESDLWEEA